MWQPNRGGYFGRAEARADPHAEACVGISSEPQPLFIVITIIIILISQLCLIIHLLLLNNNNNHSSFNPHTTLTESAESALSETAAPPAEPRSRSLSISAPLSPSYPLSLASLSPLVATGLSPSSRLSAPTSKHPSPLAEP